MRIFIFFEYRDEAGTSHEAKRKSLRYEQSVFLCQWGLCVLNVDPQSLQVLSRNPRFSVSLHLLWYVLKPLWDLKSWCLEPYNEKSNVNYYETRRIQVIYFFFQSITK